jgi:hypothetical protein
MVLYSFVRFTHRVAAIRAYDVDGIQNLLSLDRRAHNTLFNLSTLLLSLHVSSQFLFFFEGGLLVFLSTCHPLSPVITLYVRIKTRFVLPPHFIYFFFFFSFLFLSFFLYVLVNVPRSRAINTRRQHMQI